MVTGKSLSAIKNGRLQSGRYPRGGQKLWIEVHGQKWPN